MWRAVKWFIRKSFNLFGFELRRYRKTNGVRILSAIEYNTPEKATEFYSDPKYWKKYLERSGYQYYAAMHELLSKKGINYDGKDCCDVGCGTGHLLLSIRENYSPSALTGFDVVPAALEIAKETVPDVDIHYGNLLEYDSQRRFDIVFCAEVLEHIVQAEQALRNLVTMTKKSGVCFVGVPNGREDQFVGHINFWSPESWDFFVRSTCKDCDIETGLWFNNKKNYAVIKPY